MWGVEFFARFKHGSYGPISAEELGQTGDLFGGISALFAALAFLGVAIGAYYQNKTWRISERQHIQQSFEPLFFQLISLHRDIAREVLHLEAPVGWASPAGGLSLAGAAEGTKGDISNAWGEIVLNHKANIHLVHDGYDELYSLNEGVLGPYFRSLYHVFSLIDRAGLAATEKRQYANIARALLGADALFLLLINCITLRGAGLKGLVEKYGLLKHIKRVDGNGPSHEALLVQWYYDSSAAPDPNA